MTYYSPPIFLITLAGTPAITVLAGTSLLTTAPAATTAFSPTVTPGKIVAFAPSQAFSLIRTAFNSTPWRFSGSRG